MFKFILSHPQRAVNIGAAARALQTMGAGQLVLVDPGCDHLSGEARASAHQSEQILEKAMIYPSLNAAIAGEKLDLTIGTTARHRQTSREYIECEALRDFILKTGADSTIGIVFGCEQSGLSNAEIAECDVLSTIALANSQPSLNLAQSVMLYAFVLSRGRKPLVDQRLESKQVSTGEHAHLRRESGILLERLGFAPGDREYEKIMARLSHLSGTDLRLMQKVRSRIDSHMAGPNGPGH